MDTIHYSSEKPVQILIALLKAHGIKKVVASPGTTNLTFVGSLQNDDYFEMYSSAEERSAAYLACGMAAESNEPVVLTCTGATASRNYLSGLTEAYYRKLPVLAVTSTQHQARVGQHVAQVIDRSVIPNDVAKLSVHIPDINSEEDEWACALYLNKAILELRHRGGGPVHINLTTNYSRDFSIQKLPNVKVIRRYMDISSAPAIHASKVAVYVGSHIRWNRCLTESVETFCENYNGAVICDHTSNYSGKYKILASIVRGQKQYSPSCLHADLVIHIGEVTGASIEINTENVWRVNPDGEIRDTFKRLQAVFEMDEEVFFRQFAERASQKKEMTYYEKWKEEIQIVYSKINDFPFSNVWIAKETCSHLPRNSELHLGILNSLRAWNYFPLSEGIEVYANTGGFGIDGCVSALIGASLINADKIYFGVVGDLAFFYDMSSLGNRHLKNNIRLMVVNNGKGTEFRNYNHPASRFGDDADLYMAAAGHYGNKSRNLIRHYAEDLGFIYLTAHNKKTYLDGMQMFTTEKHLDHPLLFEVFTDSKDESDAVETIQHLLSTTGNSVKQIAKSMIGEKGISTLKSIIKK